MAAAERPGEFPRDLMKMLGELGLTSLPYPEEFGGGGPAGGRLPAGARGVRARLAGASRWGVSVHVLSCHGVAAFGTDEQKRSCCPTCSAAALGAYCLSEPQAGSDPAAMRTTAVRDGDAYLVNGDKAWITHGSVADFFLLLARTGGQGAHGIRPSWLPGGRTACPRARPSARWACADRRPPRCTSPTPGWTPIGWSADEGQGFAIAMTALDTGRLGIAACAVGLAQSALDAAVAYAAERSAFGRRIDEFQGVSFLLADAAAGIEAARQLYLYAARRKDAGLPFSLQAAMAKLTATETAMRVTTDMVQVLGGAGYVEDFPVERYMREAKVLQIVEGTSQIQRLVISRSLTKRAGR